MHRIEAIDLGSYRGDNYILVGFVEPEPQDGEDFDPNEDADAYGVTVARKTKSGSNIEVVRMDTAHGQDPHMDRAYLPPGTEEDRKVDLDKGFTYTRMKRYLLSNWQEFADRYIDYHE